MFAADHLEDQADFLLLPRHQELLGDRAKDCDIPVSIEKTGLEDRGQYALSYVLFRCVCVCVYFWEVARSLVYFYLVRFIKLVSFLSCRRFTPDFFQGCSVEETQLHSLQLCPLFTSQYSRMRYRDAYTCRPTWSRFVLWPFKQGAAGMMYFCASCYAILYTAVQFITCKVTVRTVLQLKSARKDGE